MPALQATFYEGMDLNSSPRMRSKASTYNLNAVLESLQGDRGSISNEVGNTLITSVPYTPNGFIKMDDNEFVLFSTDDTNSEIGVFNTLSQTYTSCINDPCLGFKTTHPIKGVFRTRQGCNRVIYFTDRLNKFRVIDLDNLEAYKDEQGNWDCNTMSLERDFLYPRMINTQVLDSGGQLPLGAYSFSVRLLDANLNPTNWSYPSSAVHVYDDAITNQWHEIDGGQNIEFYTAEEGGIPVTNKSIEVTLDNIDTSFEFVELAVIQSREGIGAVTNQFVVNRKQIGDSTSLSFLITGNTSEVQQELALNEITVDKQPIDIVGTVAQLDHTLWLANIKSQPYDLAALQRAASQIQVTPKVQLVNHLFPQEEFNSKHFRPKSYMGGEVYALSIVYFFKDGSTSQAFHIPGRSATATDNTIINTWSEDLLPFVSEDVFNNTYAKTQAELTADPTKPVLRRWQVYDTATKTSDTEGTMGYYEVSNTYPIIKDCQGNSIWGTDASGNNLEGTPIRHHKLPTRSTFPLYKNYSTTGGSDYQIATLGFDFDNITYPHPDIVGHMFFRAIRNEDDKTILDKGALMSAPLVNNQYYSPSFRVNRPTDNVGLLGFSVNLEVNAVQFYSPITQFDKTLLNGDYFEVEQLYGEPVYFRTTQSYPTPGSFSGSLNVGVDVDQHVFVEMQDPDNRKILDYSTGVFLDSDSVQPGVSGFNNEVRNFNLVDTASVYELNQYLIDNSYLSIDDFFQLKYVSNKRIRDVYSNLFTLDYIPIQDWMHTLTDDNSTILGGDISISFMTVPAVFGVGDVGFLDSGSVSGQWTNGLWVESEINYSMRHEGSTIETQIYPALAGADQPYHDYFIEYVAFENDDGDRILYGDGNWKQEYYGYNQDFSKVSREKINGPVSIQYNYCRKCMNEFPNRIYYSRTDNQETSQDNYRVFLVNNYRNLDGLGGSITNLFVDKDELYLTTKNHTYFIPTSPQEIRTNENIAFLGTGERLSQRPRRIVSSSSGYGGTTQILSHSDSEFGTMFVDDRRGKIFMVRGNLEELNDHGARAWFERNGVLKLATQFQQDTSVEYPYRTSPMSRYGTGFSSCYDPRLRRFLITKKDYSALQSITKRNNDDLFNTTDLYFNMDKNIFEISIDGQTLTPIELSNPEYFQEESWTLSYDPVAKTWASFHSYLPILMYNDDNAFFTHVDERIYKHGEGNYQTFYGTKYPFEVEIQTGGGDFNNKSFMSAHLELDIYDNGEYVMGDPGISYWAYSNRGSTGLQSLQTFNTFDIVNNRIRFTKDRWSHSYFRDYSTSGPLFQRDYPYRTSINTDLNKSAFELKQMDGDHLNLRYSLLSPKNLSYRLDKVDIQFKHKLV